MPTRDFEQIIERYLRGELSKGAAAELLRSLGVSMIGNVPEADAEKVRDLYLHAAWLEERENDPAHAPAEPPTFAAMMANLPDAERAMLRRMGLL